MSGGDGRPDVQQLTNIAQLALWAAAGLFGSQAVLHWLRAACRKSQPGARSEGHELLSCAATAASALLYLGMANGISLTSCLLGDGVPPRPIFAFHPALRALAVGLHLLSVAVLARERRPPSVALGVFWLSSTLALYLGNFAQNPGPRLSFCAVSLALVVPMATTLLGSMGGRLRQSELLATYRFLATWLVVCCGCYPLLFVSCEITGFLDTETEMLLNVVLDVCTVSVTALVIGSVDADTHKGLLPAQEAELSLYPGPHNYGFYPNPHFYDDNL